MSDQMLTLEEQHYAIRTWRFIRITMVALVVLLFVSIVYEHFQSHCYLLSISSAFYTPVHSTFVAVYVALGVCLICVKASNPWEEVLLNLAGGSFPLTAFVPKPTVDSCASHLEGVADRSANIGNNVVAYLIVIGVALALLIVLRVVSILRGQGLALTKPGTVGGAVAVTAWTLTFLGYLAFRSTFDREAHYVASGVVVVCMVAVIAINAFETKVLGSYGWVAIATLVAIVASVVAKFAGWAYWLFAVETSLFVMFLLFWLIQTRELWDTGIRGRPSQ
jgi:hypothetical protein